MKVSKSVKLGFAGGKAQESEGEESRFAQKTPPKEPREEAAMHMDAPLKNAAGRLSREDQRRLGDILQRVYDDVIRQGVPDRFRDLLSELDGTGDAGSAEPRPSSSSHGYGQGDGTGARGAREHDQRSDPLLRGSKGLSHPGNKGSY